MSKQQKPGKPSDRVMFYKRTFGTDPGQRVLDDLKATLKYGQTVYQPGKSEADNAFEQGRQSVINEILFTLAKEG